MTNLNCVNLMQRFGKKYQITFDECYNPKGVPRANLDPWMMVIPCRIGEISPNGGDMLQLYVDGHGITRKKLKTLHCLQLYTEGDHDACWLFDVKDFALVAKIVKPHRKPQLTNEQKQRASERMRNMKPWLRSKTKTPTFDPKTHANSPSRPQSHPNP